MNILVLGPSPSQISKFLIKQGYLVEEQNKPINRMFLEKMNVDFAISYNYRHIIDPETISYLNGKIINLHISYLPWNRGADPNLWSFLEDTPKGVSVHYVDPGIDTGDIVAQDRVTFSNEKETLATTYEALNIMLIKIFKEVWESIVVNKNQRIKQGLKGSMHRSKDKEPYLHLLAEKGWETPIIDIKGKALQSRP